MASNVVQQYPPLWGRNQFQFSNILMQIGGTQTVVFSDFSEISYSDTCEKAEFRGASPFPMGRTVGEYKAQGSITIARTALNTFFDIVAQFSPDRNSIYDAVFDFVVQYQAKAAPGQPELDVQTDRLLSCSLNGNDFSGSAGNAPIMCKFNLYVPVIIWNGFLPIAGAQVGNTNTETLPGG